MERHGKAFATSGGQGNRPAIGFLVQSALREVMSEKNNVQPGSRLEWIAHLAEALMSESDLPYQSVLSSLMANGVSSKEIYQSYIPDAARYLGELWVNDEASFVDVTVGAARLQKLFRGGEEAGKANWINQGIPLGHSVLMIIPQFEQHSLGAFVAADDLRRRGLWVHMGIHMEPREMVTLIKDNRFSMLGMTLATPENLDLAAELIDFIRKNTKRVPLIVIGGHVVNSVKDAARRCGADHAVTSATEAMKVCGLPSAAQMPGFDEHCR